MSDCRLSQEEEEGVVEDEMEVRVEEYTLRGGQESYRRRISIPVVAQRRTRTSSRYRYCSWSSWVTSFRRGWGNRQTAHGELVGKLRSGPNGVKGAHQRVFY
jgi:hypothetical protein